MKAATQQPPPSRQERERERLRMVAAQRKQERWLNPSAASLEREHEYLAWLETRPQQHGNEPRNDTFEIFLTERRKAKEKERLRLVAEQRRPERCALISTSSARMEGTGIRQARRRDVSACALRSDLPVA